MVFDHVDYCPDGVLRKYVRRAAAIVSVSPAFCEAIAKQGGSPHWIPNGIDIRSYTRTDRRNAKEKLGIHDYHVVSLIGLTCSPSLYFIDAVSEAAREVDRLLLLCVGSGSILQSIKKRAHKLGLRHLMAPGFVPPSHIHDYFQATDIGLYPGEDTPVYRNACPIKILEYTAAHVPVISSPVDMFSKNWPNVLLTPPSIGDFKNAIIETLSNPPHDFPDMRRYDWDSLTDEFDAVIRSVRTRAA
jgi:glycosyltransferase involved in cell wall biosynthesis